MSKGTLQSVEAAVAELRRSAQAESADPGQLHRRREAAACRAQLEADQTRTLVRIESISGEIARLQERLSLVAAEIAKVPFTPRPGTNELDRREHERRWIGVQVEEKLAEIGVLLGRARSEAAFAAPRIARFRMIEAGHSDEDIDRLQQLEAAEAVRQQHSETVNVDLGEEQS